MSAETSFYALSASVIMNHSAGNFGLEVRALTLKRETLKPRPESPCSTFSLATNGPGLGFRSPAQQPRSTDVDILGTHIDHHYPKQVESDNQWHTDLEGVRSDRHLRQGAGRGREDHGSDRQVESPGKDRGGHHRGDHDKERIQQCKRYEQPVAGEERALVTRS